MHLGAGTCAENLQHPTESPQQSREARGITVLVLVQRLNFRGSVHSRQTEERAPAVGVQIHILFFKRIIDFRERGREKEGERNIVVPCIDAFIGCFLYVVPRQGIDCATWVHLEDALPTQQG